MGIILIVLLVVAIFGVGIAALSNQQAYVREARITPTPSITPRTALITENPAYPTSTPTPLVLQMNSVGIEVKQLQMRLQELGYYSGEVDGQFGGGTRTSVEAFQRQHGLDADGIAGDFRRHPLVPEETAAAIADHQILLLLGLGHLQSGH